MGAICLIYEQLVKTLNPSNNSPLGDGGNMFDL